MRKHGSDTYLRDMRGWKVVCLDFFKNGSIINSIIIVVVAHKGLGDLKAASEICHKNNEWELDMDDFRRNYLGLPA